MIDLTYQQGVLIYLGLWLATIFILWTREFLRLRRRDWELGKNTLFRCRACGTNFKSRDDEGMRTARCPKCNTFCLR